MEEAKGLVRHVLLVKFKDEVLPDEIESLIKRYANLVNIIEQMKSFEWGKDVSTQNKNEGFTHVFESNFESTEAVEEYLVHPAHVEFSNSLSAALDKIIMVTYKPTTVR